MQDDDPADFIRIPRPRTVVRGLLELLHRVLHLRTDRAKARDRGDTINAVTKTLSASGREGGVVSRQHGHGQRGRDEWSVTLGPAPRPRPAPTPSETA